MAKWAKGQSGNPGGRPKVLGDLRELARYHAPAAIKELARLALKGKSETARVTGELLDRGYGRAGQLIPDDSVARGGETGPSNRDLAKGLALLLAEARLQRVAIPQLELEQFQEPVEQSD